MNQSAKEQWLNALSSERYKQGLGCLRREEGDGFTYCCLGVLAEIAIQSGAVPGLSWGKSNQFPGQAMLVESSAARTVENVGMPTDGVYAWAGLTESQAVSLADMNDDHAMTFPQIARTIEAFL